MCREAICPEMERAMRWEIFGHHAGPNGWAAWARFPDAPPGARRQADDAPFTLNESHHRATGFATGECSDPLFLEGSLEVPNKVNKPAQ
jgi:hypothetical protein